MVLLFFKNKVNYEEKKQVLLLWRKETGFYIYTTWVPILKEKNMVLLFCKNGGFYFEEKKTGGVILMQLVLLF